MSYALKIVIAKDAPEIANVQMGAYYANPYFRALWCQGMCLDEMVSPNFNIRARRNK